MRSLTTTGNVVTAYTASPVRAFLVETDCFKASGTLVPEGIVSWLASLVKADWAAAKPQARSIKTAVRITLFCIIDSPQHRPDEER